MPPNKNLTRWANFDKLKPDLRLAARGGMSHAALPEEVRQRHKLKFDNPTEKGHRGSGGLGGYLMKITGSIINVGVRLNEPDPKVIIK